MKFSFEYDVGEQTDTIEITVSDALITRAQDVGYDLVSRGDHRQGDGGSISFIA